MKNIMNTKNLFDKDFRRELMENPKDTMSELNSKLGNNVEFKIVENTKDVFHIVFPRQELLNDLENINASKWDNASTAASVSTYGTASGTASTGGTLSTEGSWSSD